MNIKEKEEYIEQLKQTLESIKYPDNPFKNYVITSEFFDSGINSLESPEYMANASRAFKIAKTLSTDISDW